MASIQLDEDAIQWYNWYETCYGVPSWEQFKRGLLIRFSPSDYENIDGQLAKICQTSTVSEYQSRFERLSNQARDWSERQLLGTFIEGLIPEIRCEVKARQPRTMIAAISFAHLHEKKISKEISARGLCYDEKWSIEHRCKQGQLLMIEPIREEPKAKNVDSDHEGINSNENVEPTIHTMHTLADYSNPQTMEVGETLEHQPVIVLIDTSSTNNFMDSETVDQLAHHNERL